MSCITIDIVIVIATASFFLGRFSVKVLRDRYLEAKRSELFALKRELKGIAKELTRREEEMRYRWQTMVVNASEICAQMNDSEGIWTSDDDLFFGYWTCAERSSEVGE